MSIINVENLTFAYDGSGDNIFENVNFRIDTNWKLGFTGRNGRGKTTFMKLLMGKYEYRGKITSSVEFEYFPFDVSDENMLVMLLAEEICPDAENWELVKELSFLQVSDDILYRPYATLSGGEKTKVMLAMLFLRENCFLLIDEPTNHLDINGREIVSSYLKRKKGFILISHDRAVLDECIDHVLSINRMNIEIEEIPHISQFEKSNKKNPSAKEQRDRSMFNYQPQGAPNQTDRDFLSARYRFANANMI